MMDVKRMHPMQYMWKEVYANKSLKTEWSDWEERYAYFKKVNDKWIFMRKYYTRTGRRIYGGCIFVITQNVETLSDILKLEY
jgi:S-methylmethionine-dependent homocysteine/selenocysteine methylase